MGPQAAHIASLWWLMLVLAAGVFALVVAMLAVALFRPRGTEGDEDPARRVPSSIQDPASQLASNALTIAGGIILPILMLVPLSIETVRTLSQIATPSRAPRVVVEVVAYQFWWEVRFPNEGIVLANEIRIPVGEPVEIRLDAVDVIHSFWVPQLMGKIDLVPGQRNTTWVQADQPGRYLGECAEFCGVQHAKMGFVLVAEEPTRFAAWLDEQRQPAAEPADPSTRRGGQVFAREGCIACHAIQYGSGTVGGSLGPNLTHVGSRLTLGAAAIPNDRERLRAWIRDPHRVKPGVNMPASGMDAESLELLAEYLESLR